MKKIPKCITCINMEPLWIPSYTDSSNLCIMSGSVICNTNLNKKIKCTDYEEDWVKVIKNGNKI